MEGNPPDQYAVYNSTNSHHRITFKELPKSLNEEDDLVTVFNALNDTCRSEYALYSSYLH